MEKKSNMLFFKILYWLSYSFKQNQLSTFWKVNNFLWTLDHVTHPCTLERNGERREKKGNPEELSVSLTTLFLVFDGNFPAISWMHRAVSAFGRKKIYTSFTVINLNLYLGFLFYILRWIQKLSACYVNRTNDPILVIFRWKAWKVF